VAFGAAFGIAYVAGSGSDGDPAPAGTVTRGLTAAPGTLPAETSATLPRVGDAPSVGGLVPPPPPTTRAAQPPAPDGGSPSPQAPAPSPTPAPAPTPPAPQPDVEEGS
jgi:hypothetical protein